MWSHAEGIGVGGIVEGWLPGGRVGEAAVGDVGAVVGKGYGEEGDRWVGGVGGVGGERMMDANLGGGYAFS